MLDMTKGNPILSLEEENDELDAKFGQTLQRLISASHKNIADVCENTTASRSTVTKILSCKPSNPTLKTLSSIAHYFNVSLDTLVGLKPFPDHYEFGEYDADTVQTRKILLFDYEALMMDTYQQVARRVVDSEILLASDHPYYGASAKYDPRHTFALRIDQLLNKQFFSAGILWTKVGSTLIFATKSYPKDYDLVLIAANEQAPPVLKRYFIEGTAQYVAPLNSGLGAPESVKDAYILGKLISIDLEPGEMS
ncbi:MAG: Cro/C1-type DNA-binding domain [Gammaproteobacteria bacterium]|jgi:transcriptional regulator with XRE-family HTH domain|nr:Cro/C1-type DNA-binding domain [Gammaproteobacteria bacterium]